MNSLGNRIRKETNQPTESIVDNIYSDLLIIQISHKFLRIIISISINDVSVFRINFNHIRQFEVKILKRTNDFPKFDLKKTTITLENYESIIFLFIKSIQILSERYEKYSKILNYYIREISYKCLIVFENS